MFLNKIALAGSLAVLTSTASYACEISARVSIVGNEFPAIQTVGAGAQECAGAEVKTNLTADHQKINVAGMQGNPAEFTAFCHSANSVHCGIMNECGRHSTAIDDLVAKARQAPYLPVS